MHTLICGSIAYDNIMVFQDHFKNHILPDQIHILNVAFLVPQLRREFGGCAGNIAYNLRLLGGNPLIMATVGDDYGPYEYRLKRLGLAQTHIRQIPQTFTAQAFITTDLDDNQITAFHPGAMNHSHRNRVAECKDIELGIVSPDGRDGMLQHAREFADLGIPFVFDPGQGLPMFSGPELLQFLELADYVTVNDYESKILESRTGKTLDELVPLVRALIVTRGGEGSTIYADGKRHDIPSVRPQALVDPTGCGDAYRAGLLYGIVRKWSWDKIGRLASLMGSIKIAAKGGQNHAPSRDEIDALYASQFGAPL
jgi:adenosine kinase